MKSQICKNKEKLWEHIEACSHKPIDLDNARRLSEYMGAYNAMCMICGEEESVSHVAHTHEEYEEKPLTYHQIVSWVNSMENADGTHGGHWPMEQTEQVRKQKNIDCDPLMFYAAMNMMYSDYCKVAEKAGVSSVDFYVYMAKAFLDDKDAKPHKLARYYHHIAEK